MDSFLESDDEDNQDYSGTDDQEDDQEDGIESYDEVSDNENEAEPETDPNFNFTLDDIDWNKVSQSIGDNVEVIPSKDKNTPPLMLKKLRSVCNKDVLNQKLSHLKAKTSSLNWFESLTMSTAAIPANHQKRNLNLSKLKNNDFKRETFFYENTLLCVKIALNKIKKEVPNGINIIQRPNDYYAEMIKTDIHMKKIKSRILWEQKKIGIVENRKRNRRLKKYHKQMMSQKMQENSARKRRESTAIDDWKRNVNRDDRSLQAILKDARSSYTSKMSAKKKKKPNMRRIIKDLKYGSGYVQKGLKGKNKHRNTFSSTNAYHSDFKRSRYFAGMEKRGESGARRGGMKRYGNRNVGGKDNRRVSFRENGRGISRGRGRGSFRGRGRGSSRGRGGSGFGGRGRGSFRGRGRGGFSGRGKGNFDGYRRDAKRQKWGTRGTLGKYKRRGSVKRQGSTARRKTYRSKMRS